MQLPEGTPIYLSLGFYVAVTISALGFILDHIVRKHYRQEISHEWQRIDKNSWPKKFLELHDRLLTSSLSSAGRPRLGRSAALSMLSIFVIIVGWLLLGLPDNNLDNKFSADHELIILIFVIYIIPVNILGDYFSFWETRIVIGRMAEAKQKVALFLYVLLDFVVTTLLFMIFLLLGTVVFIMMFYLEGAQMDNILSEVGNTIYEILESGGWLFASADAPGINAFGVLYLTTLTTSIWVWAYMIGSLLWPAVLLLANVIEVERKPIGFAMAVGGVVLGFLVVIIGWIVDFSLPLVGSRFSAMA